MPLISILRDLKGKGGIDEKVEQECGPGERRSFDSSVEGSSSSCPVVEQSRWASLPLELLLDIIGRVEADETAWPARRAVVCCAAVCRSWRAVVREVVQTPEECGLLTFPMSLKQVIYVCVCRDVVLFFDSLFMID